MAVNFRLRRILHPRPCSLGMKWESYWSTSEERVADSDGESRKECRGVKEVAGRLDCILRAVAAPVSELKQFSGLK